MIDCPKCVHYEGCQQRLYMEQHNIKIEKCKNRKVRNK